MAKGIAMGNDKGHILTIENGSRILKYKNVIYESIKEEYKKK